MKLNLDIDDEVWVDESTGWCGIVIEIYEYNGATIVTVGDEDGDVFDIQVTDLTRRDNQLMFIEEAI